MELLALLAALGVFAVRGEAGAFHHDGWVLALRARLSAWLSGSGVQVLTVLVPAILVELLYFWAGRSFHGLAALAVLVLALLYALGRGNLGAALSAYLERWSRGDLQAAYQVLEQDADAAPGAGQAEVEDPAGLHARARQRLYYRAFERLFAVVFWFVVAGPGAAVAYRLAQIEHQAAGQQDATGRLRLRHWLDFIPARLLALSFALVGDFDATLRQWRLQFDDGRADAGGLLESCGNAALQLAVAPGDEPREALLARGAAELEAVEVLHRRALVVWLVVVALLVINV